VLSGPQRFEKSNKQGATPKIKNKIARNQLKLERGWGVAGDEKAQMELKQRIRIQDPRKVAPPTAGIQTGAAGAMGASGTIGATGAMGAAGATPMGTPVPATAPGMAASPITSATLAPNPSSFEKGKGRGKRGQAEESKAQPPAGAMGDSASPAASAAPMDQMERGRGKNKGRRGQEPGMSAPPSGAMSPAMEATPAGIERGKGKGKRNQDLQGAPSPSTGETPPSGNSEKMRGMNREQGASAMPGAGEGQVQGQGKHKGRRLDQPPGGPGEQTGAPAMGGQESQGMPSGGGKQKGRAQTIDPAEPTTGGASGTGEPGQGKHKGRGPAMEPSQPATGAAPTGDEQRGGGKQGKRKGAQETPTPIPQ
jgi:hypothetical protein